MRRWSITPGLATVSSILVASGLFLFSGSLAMGSWEVGAIGFALVAGGALIVALTEVKGRTRLVAARANAVAASSRPSTMDSFYGAGGGDDWVEDSGAAGYDTATSIDGGEYEFAEDEYETDDFAAGPDARSGAHRADTGWDESDDMDLGDPGAADLDLDSSDPGGGRVIEMEVTNPNVGRGAWSDPPPAEEHDEPGRPDDELWSVNSMSGRWSGGDSPDDPPAEPPTPAPRRRPSPRPRKGSPAPAATAPAAPAASAASAASGGSAASAAPVAEAVSDVPTVVGIDFGADVPRARSAPAVDSEVYDGELLEADDVDEVLIDSAVHHHHHDDEPRADIVDAEIVNTGGRTAPAPAPTTAASATTAEEESDDGEIASAVFAAAMPTDMPHQGPFSSMAVTLFVADLSRSIVFYRDVLGFEEYDASWNSRILVSGDVRIVVREVPSSRVDQRIVHVLLGVEDVAVTYARLKERGVEFVYRPRPMGRYAQMTLLGAALRDPDGHVVAITQWVAAD